MRESYISNSVKPNLYMCNLILLFLWVILNENEKSFYTTGCHLLNKTLLLKELFYNLISGKLLADSFLDNHICTIYLIFTVSFAELNTQRIF